MYFLIDYENVNNLGMQGTEYLLPSDYVIVFYSDAVHNMERHHLENIKKSGCTFEICKLVAVRKNALDFYIATRLGEIFDAGCKENIVIISNDIGFRSLKEYWQFCAAAPHRLLLNNSIAKGILSANEGDQRMLQVQRRLQQTHIGDFFKAYTEECKLRKRLEGAFAGTEFASRISEIEEILKTSETAAVIYRSMFHCFGRKEGLLGYQKLKECI